MREHRIPRPRWLKPTLRSNPLQLDPNIHSLCRRNLDDAKFFALAQQINIRIIRRSIGIRAKLEYFCGQSIIGLRPAKSLILALTVIHAGNA